MSPERQRRVQVTSQNTKVAVESIVNALAALLHQLSLVSILAVTGPKNVAVVALVEQ